MENFENFMEYCRIYNSAAHTDFCNDADHLLRFWREAKSEYLNTLLGNELILTKDFTYELDMTEQMENLIAQNRQFYLSLYDALREEFHAVPNGYHWDFPNPTDETFFLNVRSWNNANGLLSNRVEETISATINGTFLKINAGEKIMRALRKICQLLNLSVPYERLRQQHAQLLSQKTITGQLCLSIHPLDYATASDNANGWSSCMSWQENGCYRLGTVEMMNSPMVICAYLKSNVQEMQFSSYSWPSKKWRAWIVVTKDAILCNRNYPYDSDDLSKECIKWVAQLAQQNLGWDFSPDITRCEELGIQLDYRTNFMYNDFHSDMWATVRPNLPRKRYIINYSGVANCMNCGDKIPFYGAQDSSTLCCDNCSAVVYCSECGCVIHENDEEFYYGPNDEILCPDCFSQTVTHCENCDTDVYAEDTLRVSIPLNEELYTQLTGNNPYIASHCEQYLCPDCAKELGITPDMIVPMSFPNGWSTRYDEVLDPRRITKTVFYRLLGLPLNENNQFKYKWMEEFLKERHIDELWENYLNYFEEEGC